MPWITHACYKNLAIVGICKNAGKTTLLNAIMQQFSYKWGVMSTGHDGEAKDLLYKTPKPRVELAAGSIFCADAQCIDAHGTGLTILSKTTWLSGGKPLWIARAEQPLHTEIGGPQNVAEQIACAKKLHTLGADKVLIDGSLDRKSIALSDQLDAIVLVIGASFGNLEAVSAELSRLLKLSEIQVYALPHDTSKLQLLNSEEILLNYSDKWQATSIKSLLGYEKQLQNLLNQEPQPHTIYIPGAYTDNVHQRLSNLLKPMQLVFRHPESIKLSSIELERFTLSHQVQCLIPFKIKGITINAQGFGAPAIDADYLRNKLREKFPKLDLIDLMETGAS
ncbi:MAG: hypothetical protein RBS43_06730 [Candidatus Cloacimonas sp.]|nr:hypothetical protein [Candidatus Cloacimonas sp.]